jgi:hypothetical protein
MSLRRATTAWLSNWQVAVFGACRFQAGDTARPASKLARGMMSEFLFGTFCVRGIIIYSRFCSPDRIGGSAIIYRFFNEMTRCVHMFALSPYSAQDMPALRSGVQAGYVFLHIATYCYVKGTFTRQTSGFADGYEGSL